MRKKLTFTLLAGALLLACNPENGPGGGDNDGPANLTFHATLPSYSNGPKVSWAEGDQIAVFAEGAKNLLSASAAGSKVDFTGKVGAAPYYAISPAAAAQSFSGDKVSVTVPDEQKAVKDGIDPSVSIAVATSSGEDLTFKNILGLLKFSLVSDNVIKSVTVTSKGSDNLTGSANVSFSNGRMSVTDGKNSVVIADAAKMDKGTYYIAVIPATFVDGLTVTISDEYGRVANVSTEEFISAKSGAVLDLGAVDQGVVFTTPRLISTPFDIGFIGNGEKKTVTVPASVTSISSLGKPDWVSAVEANGTTISVTATANTDKNARYGVIEAELITADGPASVSIPIAQAATGMKIVYDSFSGPTLNAAWKGNKTRADVQYGNGYISMVGTGDYKTANPLFWTADKVRLKYSGDNCNQWICTIDCASGSAGLWMFNQHGYEDNTYDFTSTQSYCCFMPFNSGEETGGFYCFDAVSANAMDNWTSIHHDITTEWIRLEVTNIDRGDERAADEQLEHEIHGDWAAAHIYTLKEENGILIKDKLLFTKELWWWNDSMKLGSAYGYFGIFAKDEGVSPMRNFTLQFTDKQ